jgi:hypothetical protein
MLMDSPVIIRGTFTNQVFVPESPMPQIEGPAELIMYQQKPESDDENDSSLFNLFGKAPQLRSAEELDAQLKAERDSWDDE